MLCSIHLFRQHKDDKPFLHKMNGLYYLSWGCWYAVGSSPYGPFNFSGSVINSTALANTSFASGGGTQVRPLSIFAIFDPAFDRSRLHPAPHVAPCALRGATVLVPRCAGVCCVLCAVCCVNVCCDVCCVLCEYVL